MMTLLIFSVTFALSISFVCSLLEATLLSFSPSQVATLERKRPGVGAIWRNFKEHIERPIAVILIINTAAHTIGATMAGAQFETIYGTSGLIGFSIVFTYVMLQFTEILPKTLGVRYNESLAPVIARPMTLVIRVLSPVVWFIHLMNRPFERGQKSEVDTLDEIAALASSARLRRLMDPHQARMIQAASEFEDIIVRQIMTPRTEVTFLRSDAPIEDILDVLKRSPHTRIPICEGDFDHVIGIVHIKDVMKELDLMPGRFDIEEDPAGTGPAESAKAVPGSALHVFGTGSLDLNKIKREVVFLPEQLSLFHALRRFQDARLHLAIVVDEYGSTQGIVTLEDVIEEIVGDIQDEFDLLGETMIRKEGSTYHVSGRFPFHELHHHIPDLGIEHADVEADTIGGFVIQQMGHIPQSGETIEAGAYRWKIVSADLRRVREVLLTPIVEPETETPVPDA